MSLCSPVLAKVVACADTVPASLQGRVGLPGSAICTSKACSWAPLSVHVRSSSVVETIFTANPLGGAGKGSGAGGGGAGPAGGATRGSSGKVRRYGVNLWPL